MSKRHQDAVFISQGACNPSGIALSLHNACKECLDEGVSQREDPAVRLIAYQLAYLLNLSEFNASQSAYAEALKKCELLS